MSIILTINAGSSSVKYQCFEMADEVCLAKGQVDRLGSSSPTLFYERHDNVTYQTNVPPTEYEAVFALIFEILLDTEKGVLQNLNDIVAVGHRVVHGGSRFGDSALITSEVETAINQCVPLAPLHNPYNLGGIRACHQALPNAAHVAVFDTAFHQTMPDTPTCTRSPTPFMNNTVFGDTAFTAHRTDTSQHERRKSSDAH